VDDVVEVRRTTAPLVTPLEGLYEGRYEHIPEELRPYFRDVYDHVQRANERVEGFRELLGGLLDATTALITLRQNDIVRRISGWAAIIAVPTLISGIYGMNFDHMPELHWAVGYPLALALMLALAVGVYALLKRAEWM
jgi:magnesium transporter